MKILIPTDGSKSSLNAVKYAAKLASALRTKNTVTLINVHDEAGLLYADQFAGVPNVTLNLEEMHDYLLEMSRKELKSAQKILDKANVKHDMIIGIGRVSDEILEVANKDKYDLIIMGSKGRSAFADFLVGSVAQRVLHSAKQPVLLVK
jgi:nucleotide-binding universal stress UspA family protein